MWTQVCLDLKSLGSALSQAASPSCRSLGWQGKCQLREQWSDLTNINVSPFLLPLPKDLLASRKRQGRTPPPSPWHCMIPRDIQPRDVSCLGCWPNKEIQDKPVILSWPHPAARQAETMAKRNSPSVFNGTFQEEMKLPSVAPLWGGEQGLPWRQSNGPPATSQRVKNSTACPQTLHTNQKEFLWGRVCLRYYWKRNQVCTWQFLQSPHSFHWHKNKNVPLLKLLTLGFNWMPRGGQQFTFIARRWEGPLGVTVNPRNRLTLGTLLLQCPGSLKNLNELTSKFWFALWKHLGFHHRTLLLVPN